MISPRHYNCAAQRGVTLTELLIVIIIIGIVSTFALMQRGSANEQFQRQNVARELKVAFERARFDSVKRRAECSGVQAKVVVNATNFTLWTDKDADGTPESSETESTDFSGQNIVVSGPGFSLPVTVSFNQRGEVTATDGTVSSTNPGFFVCNGVSCPGTPTNGDTNKVYVTQTGTVDLIGGGESLPSFGAAGGTVVGTSDEININLLLSGGGGCS